MCFLKLIIHQDNYDRDVVRTSDLNPFRSFTILFLHFLHGLASIENIYQTFKVVKKIPLRVLFSTLFSVFQNVVKDGLSRLVYYVTHSLVFDVSRVVHIPDSIHYFCIK